MKTQMNLTYACIVLLFICITPNVQGTKLKKELLYDKYTLEDNYNYKKEERSFQWAKITNAIDYIDYFYAKHREFGFLVNYKNRKGRAPLAKDHVVNDYNAVEDAYGVFKYQAIPLYAKEDTLYPARYGRDGSLIAILRHTPNFYVVVVAAIPNQIWYVPNKYVKLLKETEYNYLIAIDRKQQHIATLERSDSVWLIRSMNPATTGKYHPPYSKLTPMGIFVLQEKKPKMYYLKDGTSQLQGYAPYASRFCCGGYIHGVPVNNVNGSPIEHTWTLGTIPRSHMCVRNVTSHAKFIYDYMPTRRTLLFIYE